MDKWSLLCGPENNMRSMGNGAYNHVISHNLSYSMQAEMLAELSDAPLCDSLCVMRRHRDELIGCCFLVFIPLSIITSCRI